MALLNLSSPWVIFYREVQALFAEDPSVHVVYDEQENHINLYVDKGDKAEALSLLLPDKKMFGDVTVRLSIIPANNGDGLFGDYDKAELFEIAFFDNNAYSFSKTITGVFTNNLTYVVFKKKVVQYFNDDLGDAFGLCSTLYQNIAKDVFKEMDGVYYSTDKDDNPFDGYKVNWP